MRHTLSWRNLLLGAVPACAVVVAAGALNFPAAALGGIDAPGLVAPSPQAATLQITPSTGPGGTVVTAQGAQFPPLTEVTFNWNGHETMVTALGAVTTDSSGSFNTLVQIPADAQNGVGRVLADAGDAEGVADFTVGPLSPLSSAPEPIGAGGPSPTPQPTDQPAPAPSPSDTPAADPSPSPSAQPSPLPAAPEPSPSAPPKAGPAPLPQPAPGSNGGGRHPAGSPALSQVTGAVEAAYDGVIYVYRIHLHGPDAGAGDGPLADTPAVTDTEEANLAGVPAAQDPVPVAPDPDSNVTNSLIRLTDEALATWAQTAWFDPQSHLRFIENIREWVDGVMARSPIDSVRYHLGLANLRLKEAARAAHAGDRDEAVSLLHDYAQQMQAVTLARSDLSEAEYAEVSGLLQDNAYRQRDLMARMAEAHDSGIASASMEAMLIAKPFVPSSPPQTLQLAPLGR